MIKLCGSGKMQEVKEVVKDIGFVVEYEDRSVRWKRERLAKD